jgi:hypothetical protein
VEKEDFEKLWDLLEVLKKVLAERELKVFACL